jgi:hypothetical protein
MHPSRSPHGRRLPTLRSARYPILAAEWPEAKERLTARFHR